MTRVQITMSRQREADATTGEVRAGVKFTAVLRAMEASQGETMLHTHLPGVHVPLRLAISEAILVIQSTVAAIHHFVPPCPWSSANTDLEY